MTIRSGSPTQDELFDALMSALGGIGYSNELLKPDYTFPDYFHPELATLTAPAAAFGQTPVGYDSACFAVLRSGEKEGIDLVRDFRALGAPRAFEVRTDRVIHWRVSLNPAQSDEQETIWPESLPTHFRQNRAKWEPSKILRAKDMAAPGPRQLDFVDMGLLPALEEHVKAKLGPLLKAVLHDAELLFKERHRVDPEHDKLVRLVFRALTGKVMSDRGVDGFDIYPGLPRASDLLQQIAEHYRDSQPILSDSVVQQAVVDRLWQSFSFQNLSVEILAFIWEDTLVTDAMRVQYGIHATPAVVARYVTHRLPIGDIKPKDRRIVEPCCGSAVFLVSALHHLKELLPPLMDVRRRHQYFQRMLTGFDVEDFGLEVARSCLMLADFPNPNGWRLRSEDVFAPSSGPKGLVAALKKARVVLCNPPFEDFTEDEREGYDGVVPQKPAELLNTVLEHLHPDGMIGFVLPAAILEGRSYRKVRRQLAERFQRLEVVRLPDKIFQRAEFPSALLLATHPAQSRHRVTVSYAAVTNEATFLSTGDVGYVARKSMTVAEVQHGISAPALAELWEFLKHNSRLKTFAKPLSRGVEWLDFKANREKYVADKPKRGHVPGFHTANELMSFEPPPVVYLWNRPESRRGGAWGLPWNEPKVVVNAVRKARQPWRLAACPVELNVIAAQNFTVAWPIHPWTVNTLAAVLNGPVAAAFVASHESWKHNKKSTLAAIPLPDLSEESIGALEQKVADYRKAAALAKEFGEPAGLFGGFALRPILQRLLQDIDAIVLRGYRLPPELQNPLFAYFGNHPRPVPFTSDISAIERRIHKTDETPEMQNDDLRDQWDLFRRAMEDDRYPQRSLFRCRE
jgi:N-6 DNA Methylase